MQTHFANCTVDSDGREVLIDGTAVPVEPKALELLLYLIEHRDRAIGKDELQDEVWGTIVTESALTRCVMKLRKALGPDAAEAIRTVRGYGYRFVGAADEGAPAETGEQRERVSIAVLPLVNMSADPANEYFSDGLAEEILNLLAKIPALSVTSRTSAFAMRGRSDDVRTIAAELGVDYVLEGSVRRSDNRVRIAQQLIDAREDTHIWSEIYDRELVDVFAVQAEIAREVVGAFNIDSAGRLTAYAATQSISAYDFYLRGRHYFHQWDNNGFELSRVMFEKAIETDPDYAMAWAGLADTLTSKVMWVREDESLVARAQEASIKSLQLDPNLAEAHVARGYALSLGEAYDEATERFENGISLNPMLFEAWYLYARSAFAEGHIEKAAELFGRAAEIRRDDYQTVCLQAQALESLGSADAQRVAQRAIDRTQRHLELFPTDTRALTLGAGCLLTVGRRDECIEWCQRALAIAPNDMAVLHNVACSYSAMGEIDTALDYFERRFAQGKAHKHWLDNDPDFDNVRDHPRFKAMLRT